MAFNPVTGDLCYLAGCFVVIYSVVEARQIMFLQSPKRRPFQSLAFSKDGKFLAAGENSIKLAQVTVWEIQYEEKQVLKRAKGKNTGDSMMTSHMSEVSAAT